MEGWRGSVGGIGNRERPCMHTTAGKRLQHARRTRRHGRSTSRRLHASPQGAESRRECSGGAGGGGGTQTPPLSRSPATSIADMPGVALRPSLQRPEPACSAGGRAAARERVGCSAACWGLWVCCTATSKGPSGPSRSAQGLTGAARPHLPSLRRTIASPIVLRRSNHHPEHTFFTPAWASRTAASRQLETWARAGRLAAAGEDDGGAADG